MIGYHSRGQQRTVTKSTGSGPFHCYYIGMRQVTVASVTTPCAAKVKLKIAPISSCSYKALIYEIVRTIPRA